MEIDYDYFAREKLHELQIDAEERANQDDCDQVAEFDGAEVEYKDGFFFYKFAGFHVSTHFLLEKIADAIAIEAEQRERGL